MFLIKRLNFYFDKLSFISQNILKSILILQILTMVCIRFQISLKWVQERKEE
jgi:hypothetical protein